MHEDCADEKEILAELQQVRMQDSLLIKMGDRDMEIQEMEKYENQLDSLKSMMEKYELDTEDISAYEEEMKDFHVTTPMVGKFSSGKTGRPLCPGI